MPSIHIPLAGMSNLFRTKNVLSASEEARDRAAIALRGPAIRMPNGLTVRAIVLPVGHPRAAVRRSAEHPLDDLEAGERIALAIVAHDISRYNIAVRRYRCG